MLLRIRSRPRSADAARLALLPSVSEERRGQQQPSNHAEIRKPLDLRFSPSHASAPTPSATGAAGDVLNVSTGCQALS